VVLPAQFGSSGRDFGVERRRARRVRAAHPFWYNWIGAPAA